MIRLRLNFQCCVVAGHGVLGQGLCRLFRSGSRKQKEVRVQGRWE